MTPTLRCGGVDYTIWYVDINSYSSILNFAKLCDTLVSSSKLFDEPVTVDKMCYIFDDKITDPLDLEKSIQLLHDIVYSLEELPHGEIFFKLKEHKCRTDTACLAIVLCCAVADRLTHEGKSKLSKRYYKYAKKLINGVFGETMSNDGTRFLMFATAYMKRIIIPNYYSSYKLAFDTARDIPDANCNSRIVLTFISFNLLEMISTVCP